MACAVFFITLVLAATVQPAQAQDFGVQQRGVLGEPQVIEASVDEDLRPLSVTLFHRLDPRRDYATLPMRPTTRAGVYAATVPTAGTRAQQLEFYIVASNDSGRTQRSGSANSPLVRELVPDPSLPEPIVSSEGAFIGEPPVQDDRPILSGKRRYLLFALGILAVGAIAAAASSGDGVSVGGGGGGCGGDGCNTTLILNPP